MPDAYTSAVNRANAYTRWSQTENRTAATQSWRDGFLASLRARVLEQFPGLTDEAEIENQVERLLKLHYEKMRASSLKTRRENAQRKRRAATDAMLDVIAGEAV